MVGTAHLGERKTVDLGTTQWATQKEVQETKKTYYKPSQNLSQNSNTSEITFEEVKYSLKKWFQFTPILILTHRLHYPSRLSLSLLHVVYFHLEKVYKHAEIIWISYMESWCTQRQNQRQLLVCIKKTPTTISRWICACVCTWGRRFHLSNQRRRFRPDRSAFDAAHASTYVLLSVSFDFRCVFPSARQRYMVRGLKILF